MTAAAAISANGDTRRSRAPRPRCVIDYVRDGYETGKELYKGRRVAGRNFLSALSQHSDGAQLYCLAHSAGEFAQFAEHVQEFSNHTKEAAWLQPRDLGRLEEGACLYRGDPGLAKLAWDRRWQGDSSYTLCGTTHTLCSLNVIDALGELLIAPLAPWDALVCTSQAAKSVVQTVFADYGEYLQDRFGGTCTGARLQLPVIPLGVDCQSFGRPSDYVARRKACRKRWGVHTKDSKEIVLLFAGRLSFHAKANPYALFAATHHVAKQTGRKIAMVLAGQFPNRSIKASFERAWVASCPDLRLVCPPNENNDLWDDIWYGADIFVSLVDNVQETFGLTPLEAMAAGLPVVVSDWDGYRDTVRHGVDGFRVRTTMPLGGAGYELIHRYESGQDNYDRYIGHTSGFVGVDIQQTIDALAQLVGNPQLRQQMGAEGRKRAEQFDWRHVVSQYEALWQELNACRLAEGQQAGQSPRSRTHPLRQDPFRLFSHFASHRLSDDDILTGAEYGDLETALNLDVMDLARRFLCNRRECEEVLTKLRRKTCSMREVLDGCPQGRQATMRRTLSWMHKAGLVKVIESSPNGRGPNADGLTSHLREANGQVPGRRWFYEIGKRLSFHRSR